MKAHDYIKKMGRVKIAEICNWDLEDIRLHLKRETDVTESQISREMQEFYTLFNQKTEIYRTDPRIEELISKLKGGKQ